MTKKKVYISLPISGYDIEAVKDRAGRAAKYLQDKGYEPITPFDVSPDNEATYAAHMGKDIHALLECDAVFFLYGWWNSKGCQLERMAAMIYGKEMMHDASKGSVEFERVLPYPPFMKGDIVTYNGCLSTKAVFFERKSVYSNLLWALKVHKIAKAEREERINAVLKEFDIEALKKERVKNLCGSDRRLVQIARMALRPLEIVLCDDVLSEYDADTVERIKKALNLLFDSAPKDKIIIMAGQTEEACKDFVKEYKYLKSGSFVEKQNDK